MRGICAGTLTLEAIVIALATPVMIAVEDVDPTVALVVGLGLALVAVGTAGMLRFRGAYLVGHAVQLAAIAMGVLVTAMFFVGFMFAALWVTAFLLGRKIEADRASRLASGE